MYLSRKTDGATLTLDMYFPAEPVGAPLVVGADPRTVDGLLAKGVIVVTLDEDDSLGEGPGGPEDVLSDPAFMRATAERFTCAIRFARARASELGNDDPIVVLTGVSFGGGATVQVALFGATLDERWDRFEAAGGPPRQFECEVPSGSTHVDAVIGMAGTYDLSMPIFDGMYGRAYQQQHDPELQQFLTGAIGANPDLKIRLLHGIYDDIPVEFAAEFAALLEDAGYDIRLTRFSGGHEHAPTALFLSAVMEVLGR